METVKRKYILTQDTNSLLELLGPTENLEQAAGGYLGSIQSIIGVKT